MKKYILIFLGLLLTSFWIWLQPGYLKAPEESSTASSTKVQTTEAYNLEISSTSLKVDFARTQEERNLGLSHKESLAADAGMLFIFDREDKYGFWMKDMKFPINIIWINKNKQVIGCEKGASVESYPKAFYPPSQVLYALEVNSLFCETHDVKVGEKVNWVD